MASRSFGLDYAAFKTTLSVLAAALDGTCRYKVNAAEPVDGATQWRRGYSVSKSNQKVSA